MRILRLHNSRLQTRTHLWVLPVKRPTAMQGTDAILPFFLDCHIAEVVCAAMRRLSALGKILQHCGELVEERRARMQSTQQRTVAEEAQILESFFKIHLVL